MQKEMVNTKNAPAAIGPYSQAIISDGKVFTSGQLPLNPGTGELVSDDIASATKQCIENLKAVLEEAGSSLDKVIKTTVFLKDIGDFSAFNEVYSGYFSAPYPARSCFQVACLPLNALIEIEAVAAI